MVSQVFAGLDESGADYKHANLLTAKETAAHLCECYVMLDSRIRGEEYQWGTYKVGESSWEGIQREMGELRARASEAALTAGDDKSLWYLNEFMVGHDQYHVGQMCAVRLARDPEWDAYSIYRSDE